MAYAIDKSGGSGELTTSEQAWAKIDELHRNFDELMTKRLEVYKTISAMPLGAERDSAVTEFNDIENSFLSYVWPGVKKIFDTLGYESPNTQLPGTLGFLPAIWAAFVGASWATQLIVAASAVALIGYTIEITARYSAMLIRPSLAPYVNKGSVSDIVKSSMKYLVIGGLAIAAIYVLAPTLLKGAKR